MYIYTCVHIYMCTYIHVYVYIHICIQSAIYVFVMYMPSETPARRGHPTRWRAPRGSGPRPPKDRRACILTSMSFFYFFICFYCFLFFFVFIFCFYSYKHEYCYGQYEYDHDDYYCVYGVSSLL